LSAASTFSLAAASRSWSVTEVSVGGDRRTVDGDLPGVNDGSGDPWQDEPSK